MTRLIRIAGRRPPDGIVVMTKDQIGLMQFHFLDEVDHLWEEDTYRTPEAVVAADANNLITVIFNQYDRDYDRRTGLFLLPPEEIAAILKISQKRLHEAADDLQRRGYLARVSFSSRPYDRVLFAPLPLDPTAEERQRAWRVEHRKAQSQQPS